MDYEVMIEPTDHREDRSVLIIVPSNPENFNKRSVIRKTWGSWSAARVIYLLGISMNHPEDLQMKIENEAAANKDILQFGIREHYRNLTLKSCALVMWAVRNPWPQRKFVIKVDDDTCVNTSLLGRLLSYFTHGVYGEFRRAKKPIRCRNSGCMKWGLTREEYGPTKFPPHVQGSFYVITESVLAKLNKFLFIPKFIFIEDVYLTGLVTQAASVPVKPMPEATLVDPYPPTSFWSSRMNVVAQHRCDERFQLKFWEHARRNRTHRFGSEENEIRFKQ